MAFEYKFIETLAFTVLVFWAKGPMDSSHGITLCPPCAVSSQISETTEDLGFLFCKDVSHGTITMHKNCKFNWQFL